MTGKWREPGVPHVGWRCEGVTDIREDDSDAELAVCEMCEATEIRYVHYMVHDNYPNTLAVGQICAGKMEQDYAAAKGREREARNASARKTRARTKVARSWRKNRHGNYWQKIGGVFLLVFRDKRSGKWQGKVEQDGAVTWGQKFFDEWADVAGALEKYYFDKLYRQ
jgi:hypothetical protein